MQSVGMKAALFAALVAVCVFLGIDIATSGLERVHGPLPAASAESPVRGEPAAAQQGQPAQPVQPAQPPAAQPLPAADAVQHAAPSFINRAMMQLGDGLQYLAKGAIRFVTDLFSALMY